MNIFVQYQTERGFTARESATSLGVPLSTWRKWLAGTRTPGRMTIQQVTQTLDAFRAVQAIGGVK